jgi:hypothetical protein
VVQSLHKTLPSLTQTAIAHVGGLIDPARFQAQLDIFETSSPSYLLMASIDGCVRLLGAEKDLLFAGWAEKLDAFDRAVNGLKRLTLPGHGAPASPAMHAFDRSKILISTRGTSLTGPALMELLRSKYGIELEMASCDYALAMTGLTEPDSSLEALAAALREIDRDCAPAHGKSEPLEALNLSETDLDCAPASKTGTPRSPGAPGARNYHLSGPAHGTGGCAARGSHRPHRRPVRLGLPARRAADRTRRAGGRTVLGRSAALRQGGHPPARLPGG